jgi:hypothetical protein
MNKINEFVNNYEDKSHNIQLFDNIDHLKKVVVVYSNNVFRDIKINKNMLDFIIATFIDDDFLYKGTILVGSMCYEDTLTHEQMIKAKQQKVKFEEFCELYNQNFKDKDILDPSEQHNWQHIGEGSFGIIYPIENNRAIKYITNEFSSTIKEKCYINLATANNDIYAWMVEFCTFIIVMSILIYIDNMMIVDDSKRHIMCLANKCHNKADVPEFISTKLTDDDYYLGYYSFMAKLDKPFIKENIDPDYVDPDNAGKYLIGYVIEVYEDTIDNLIANLNTNDDVVNCINLMRQIFEILQKLSQLSNLGIVVSHRDFSTKNVMYVVDKSKKNKYKIRLIDFGFLCTKINFKDGKSINVGWHPYGNKYDLHLCDKKYIDVVFFITWCIVHACELFTKIHKHYGINVTSQFKRIIIKNKPMQSQWDQLLCNNINVWQFVSNYDILDAYLPLYRRIDDSIFEKIYNILDNVIKVITQIPGLTYIADKIEVVDYGNIKLFDIHDKDPSSQYGLINFNKSHEATKKHCVALFE